MILTNMTFSTNKLFNLKLRSVSTTELKLTDMLVEPQHLNTR